MNDTITRLRPAKTVIRQQIDPALRKRIATAVERLIATLDATEDTDTDTQNDDYPIDDDEREPSLGSVDNARDQKGWSAGGGEDMEGDEHDGREPDVDDEEDDPGEDNGDKEPSLGWTIIGSCGATSFVTDGEQGSLSAAELDAIRERRRAQQPQPERPADGSECAFVYVSLRPDGTICNVRAIPPEEQAAALRKAGII